MNRIYLLLVSLGLAGGVFVFDRWTKTIFFGHDTARVIGSILQTTSHQNFGLIANLPVPLLVIVLVTGAVVLVIAWAIGRSIVQMKMVRALTFALILGGALGNLYDRLTYGFVFDWILLFNWSIINLADIAIGAGIIWTLLTLDQHDKVA